MQPTKRTLLLGGGSLAAMAALAPRTWAMAEPKAADRGPAPSSPDLELWYNRPAGDWLESLPLGNGRLGAMCDSGVELETLQLNEDTFWSGGPYSSTRPGAFKHLETVRALIFAGKPLEAQAIMEQHMMAVPSRQMPYQTLGALQISHRFSGSDAPVKAYFRRLDLGKALLTAGFERGEARYEREVFISTVDQALVYRCTLHGPGSLNADIGYRRDAGAGLSAKALSAGRAQLEIEGTNADAYGVDGKLRFFGGVEVRCEDGRVEALDDHIEIRGARSFELRVAVATNFVSYNDVSGDPQRVVRDRLKAASQKRFEPLLAAHVVDYAKLFGRFELILGSSAASPRASLPTDQRIALNDLRADPGLAALLAQYGRYLLICCSRPGTQPANLQGLWNREDSPIWGSKYTININAQMNYWAAEAVGLEDCVEPLIGMVRDLSQTGEAAARDHWNARGWCAHHNTDLWRAVGPIDRARSGYWPTGGAWLCAHLFDRWRYNRDAGYLASIWPVLKGAAQFFLDTLVVDPRHGYLVTCPSLSPENKTPLGTALCAGPYMDTEIIRDLFLNVAAATEALGIENEFRDQINARLAKLPPFKIGKAGQLQEWLDDWDLEAPDIHHRHISHLYAVYPSSQISPEKTPKLAAAAVRTLVLRGDARPRGAAEEVGGDFGLRYGAATASERDTTGWGLAWRACLWARLGDAERSFESLARLTGPARLQPNMFALHPPFQIDANFGAVAAVVEMLVRNTANGVELLPCLPRGFASGSVKGLRTFEDIVFDLTWSDSRLTEVTVSARRETQTALRYAGQVLALSLPAGRRVTLGVGPSGRLVVKGTA